MGQTRRGSKEYLQVKIHGLDQGLEDKPLQEAEEEITFFLEDHWQQNPPPDLRTNHLSWSKFARFIQRELHIHFDPTNHYMGGLMLRRRDGDEPIFSII
jgi:hypothetical protein